MIPSKFKGLTVLNMVSTPDVQGIPKHPGKRRTCRKWPVCNQVYGDPTPKSGEYVWATSGDAWSGDVQPVKDLFVVFYIISTTLHPPATITHPVIYVKHRHANPVIPSSLSACRRGSNHLKDAAAVDWEETLNNIMMIFVCRYERLAGIWRDGGKNPDAAAAA